MIFSNSKHMRSLSSSYRKMVVETSNTTEKLQCKASIVSSAEHFRVVDSVANEDILP